MVAWFNSRVAAAGLEEPGASQRRGAGGDLLRFGDLRVDRLGFALAALERPLVDHPPRPLVLAAAHLTDRFEDLPVGEVVPVPGEVIGQVVGGLGDPGADDETEAGVLDRVQLAADSIPASATTTMPVMP